MAFFLLLWLLNSVTEEQLVGISNYFAPMSMSDTTSGSGSVFSGDSLKSEENMPSDASGLPPIDPSSCRRRPFRRSPRRPRTWTRAAVRRPGNPGVDLEQKRFEEAQADLEKAIENMPDGDQLIKSFMVDNTVEGLRIQIVDQEGLAMFAAGSSRMEPHTRQLLESVAKVIERMPNKVAISGHTDSTPFSDPSGYTNWELSVDRALASRRVLLSAGVPEERISAAWSAGRIPNRCFRAIPPIQETAAFPS